MDVAAHSPPRMSELGPFGSRRAYTAWKGRKREKRGGRLTAAAAVSRYNVVQPTGA